MECRASNYLVLGENIVNSDLVRIEKLRLELREHNVRYYIYDSPTVSDAEYDRLFRELQNLEYKYPSMLTSDSPTQTVGADPADIEKLGIYRKKDKT